MKSTRSTVLIALAGLTLASSLSSCATLFTGKTTPVVLVDCPADLKVSDNGTPVSITRVQSHIKAHLDESTTTYFSSGVELDKKVKKHTLTLESNGKTTTVNMKAGISGGIFMLDLFTTGGLGIIIDASTKKWRKIKNNHVDVTAALNGTKPRSQHKLKKAVKKAAHG